MNATSVKKTSLGKFKWRIVREWSCMEKFQKGVLAFTLGALAGLAVMAIGNVSGSVQTFQIGFTWTLFASFAGVACLAL